MGSQFEPILAKMNGFSKNSTNFSDNYEDGKKHEKEKMT